MTWRVQDNVSWIHVEDGCVLFNASIGHFADLNASAAELWMLIANSDIGRETLTEYLVERHEVQPDEATRMTSSFLEGLKDSFMVVSDDPVEPSEGMAGPP